MGESMLPLLGCAAGSASAGGRIGQVDGVRSARLVGVAAQVGGLGGADDVAGARLVTGRASAIVGNASPDPYGACPHERSTGIAVVPIPAMPHRLVTSGSS